MDSHVFVQPVEVEVGLDRRLRSGDALIVEARSTVRDGEWIVAEEDGGPWVGRYVTRGAGVLLHPLRRGASPRRMRPQDLHVRGVVIGMRAAP